MQILSGKLTDKQELIGALNRILNYSRRGKLRRLRRDAIASYLCFSFDTLLLLQVVRLNSASMSLLRPS